MTIIKPAELEEIVYVARNMRACDREECFAQRWDDDPVALAMEVHRLPGIKWAAIDDEGQPIIIGGLMFYNPKVAQGFTFSTPLGAPENNPKAWVKVSKHAMKLLNSVFAQTDIQRVELSALAAKTKAQAWVERLGFTVEAVLRQKGKNGEAFRIYSMLKES